MNKFLILINEHALNREPFKAARDQMVNGLIETATQSAFGYPGCQRLFWPARKFPPHARKTSGTQGGIWVHVRLLEDVMSVPACWEALTLGCDHKALGFCLEPSCFYYYYLIIIVNRWYYCYYWTGLARKVSCHPRWTNPIVWKRGERMRRESKYHAHFSSGATKLD